MTVQSERLLLVAVTLAAALAAAGVRPIAVVEKAGPCAEARIVFGIAVSARAALLATLIAPATFSGPGIVSDGRTPP